VLGRLDDDEARRVEPARPARPAIWWNSRALSSRWRVPSNFARPVNTTVRIGTLMPTPSVSVPQMTFSSRSGRAARQAAVARQHPGVVHADAAAHELGQRAPKPAVKRKAPIASAIASRSSRVHELGREQRLRALHRRGLREVHDVDRRLVGRASSSSSSCSGSTDHENVSGTGAARRRSARSRGPSAGQVLVIS
jgi:hypothetical protein